MNKKDIIRSIDFDVLLRIAKEKHDSELHNGADHNLFTTAFILGMEAVVEALAESIGNRKLLSDESGDK